MKTFVLTVLLLFPLYARAAADPTDYVLTIHVSGAHFLSDCSSNIRTCNFTLQVLQVTIDGRKYELQTDARKTGLMPLGDYKAKLLPAKHPKDLLTYELLYPDRTTIQFTLVGQYE